MSTTTTRIEDDLKARVAAAAKRAGMTAHAYILAAIAQTVEQAGRDDGFHRVADERWVNVLATGETVPWDDANPGSRRGRAGSALVSRGLAS